MQIKELISPELIEAMGILASANVYPARDADKLGIDLTGPEYQNLDSLDWMKEFNQD